MNSLANINHHIDGQSARPIAGDYFPTFDPLTSEPWASIAKGTAEDVDRAVASAIRAQQEWAEVPTQVRARALWKLADLVRQHSDELAQIETRDVGKVIREMRGQMRVVPQWLRHFASASQVIGGKTIDAGRSALSIYTVKDPVGVVGIIPPFNSPIMLTVFGLAPALATGNAVVVKPSEHASVSLVRLAELCTEAGFPKGLVNVVTGDGSAGEDLVRHPGIDMIVFTGGMDTGRVVARVAADGMKKCVLELGGKSAHIVFDDAPLEAASRGVVAGIFAAAGQTCIAGSRLLVQESVADEVVKLVSDQVRQIRLGNPLDDDTDMGPLARPDILSAVQARMEAAVRAGATVYEGREPPNDYKSGWFFSPAVVTGLGNSSDLAQEELFGPVLTVIPFANDDDAIRLANDTRYDLAAGAWTMSLPRANRIAKELNVGTVWINTYRTLHYGAPFGGRGKSGLGLVNGEEGMLEFLKTKSVFIESDFSAIGDPFKGR